jgi:hypothetical protein
MPKAPEAISVSFAMPRYSAFGGDIRHLLSRSVADKSMRPLDATAALNVSACSNRTHYEVASVGTIA